MTDSDGKQRLFFALWPEPGLQQALAAQARRALGERRAKRVSAENLHITLAFLGEVDAATRGCAEGAAGRVAAVPFTLRIDRLGYWPRKGLLWAGPTQQPPELEALVADLGQALAADCGYRPDKRPFRAHVTLARKVPKMPGRIAIEPLEWPVARFALVASALGTGGASYTIVSEWPLTDESTNGTETET